MTSTYFHMTDSTGSSGFLPTVTFDCSNDGVFTSSRRTSQLAALGIDGFYEADFTNIVTTIDVSAFAFDASLVVATINGVTTINNDAFYGCTSLRSITLDTSVNPTSKRYLINSIGNSAFYGCTSLRNLHIPDTIKRIPDYLCYGCTGLEVAVMGYGCASRDANDNYVVDASINQYAFAGCSRLSFFIIPETVGTVGNNAFSNDPSLSYVAVLGKPIFGSNVFTGSMGSGARYVYDISQSTVSAITVPSGATTNTYYEYLFQASSGTTISYTDVKNRFDGFSPSPSWVKVKLKSTGTGNVTAIGGSAFIPANITAAYHQKIIGISIPSTVTTIGYGAFETWNGGTDVTCNIAAHYIPNSVTTTSPNGNSDSYTFKMNGDANRNASQTRQAVFQSGPNKIILGQNSFLYSSIRAVALYDANSSNNLFHIPLNCFSKAYNLQFINFFQKNAYSTFTRFNTTAFDGNFLSGYVGAGRHYVYIPKQINFLGSNVFANVNSDILFTVYDKTTDGPAANGTEGLASNYAGNSHYLAQGNGTNMGLVSNGTLHLICNWYGSTNRLLGFNNSYGFPYHVLFYPSIQDITNRFCNNTNLKSIAFHHNASANVSLNRYNQDGTLDKGSFDFCTNLQFVYLNNRVKTIGIYAFRNAVLNSNFDLIDAEPLEAIYHAAFYTDSAKTATDGYTSNLSQITIPSSVKVIGSAAFACNEGSGNPGQKYSFISFSFAGGPNFEFWGDYDDTLVSATTLAAYGYDPTNSTTLTNSRNSLRHMAIPAYLFDHCFYLKSVSFLDTVDASGNDIPTINANGMLQYPDLNSPMPTRLNKQILTYKIKRFGIRPFYRCRWLQSIRVPDGVTILGNQSFFDLYSCTYLYLPDSLTTIGTESFSYMNLDNKYDTSTTYANYKYAAIRFPSPFLSGIRETTMTASQFGITIGTGIYIIRYVFTIDVSSTYGAIKNGVLERFVKNNIDYFQYHVILPDNVHSLLPGATLSTSSFGSLTNLSTITLPSTLRYIPQHSFNACIYLTNVFIPTTSNLTTIEPYAFMDCSALTSFFIPNSLHRISQEAFNGCIKLASITYGDNPGIISIDHGAFYNTTRALTSIFIPASVVNIGRYAFNANGGSAAQNILNTVTIGAGSRLKAIGGFAFGNDVNNISNSATYLQNLVLPSTLRYMGGNTGDNGRTLQNAFRNKHTDNFIFPSSVTFLPYACFYADGSTTDISNVYVPMSITAIEGPRIHNGYRDNTKSIGGVGGWIFNASRAGSLIYLPSHLSGVTKPADEAGNRPGYDFPDATRARSYYKSASYSTNPLISLALSATRGTTSDAANTTQRHADISTNVTIIGNGTNSITTADGGNAGNLISVNIPSTVTTIRDHAFKGSSALVYVTFSENSHLTSIGASSFQDCSMIHDIRLPDTLTSIGQNAFYGCSNLTSISIPYNVTSLGSGAFYTNPNTSSTYTQIGQDIDGEAAYDYSADSVSLSADGSIVAIGTINNDGNGNDSGHCRVYKYISGTNTWTKLGLDIDGEAASDQSGYSVSLSSDGSIVAIGATNNDGNGNNSGHCRVYQYNSGTNVWTKLGQDIDGETASDQSGYSVSLSADGLTVAIGALANDGNGNNSGHCRVYQYISGTWTQLGIDINGEAASDQSGYSVSLSSDGSIVAIGAILNDGNGANSGHCRVYQYISGTWTQLGIDINGEAADDYSGMSVSLSADGTIVAIGATNNDGNGADSGHCRIYKYNSGTWTKIGIDIDGEAANDGSGFSVSLSADGKTVAIGAGRNDGNGADSGHCRIYTINIKSLQSVQMHQRLYNTISSSLYSYFTSSVYINFQIIPALQLTNTLNPSKLTLSQINNLYIRYRQSQLAFCTFITVAASSGTTLTLSDVTTALAGTTGFVHIDISTNVTTISYVFTSNTRIYSVAISKTVTSINTNAFSGCTNLTYLSFHPDSSCNTIGDYAFSGNNIIDLTLPDSLQTIGSNAFQSSNILTSVCIPKSVNSLGAGAFLGCPKLTSVVLPSALSSLGTGTYFSTSGSTPPGSITSYSMTSDIPHFKLSDFSLPSGIVQNVIDSAVTYIDHRAYAYYPDLTLYAVTDYQQTITSGPASYQVNNIKMPIMPATFVMNGGSWQNFNLFPIYRSVPDLNVYSDVSGTVTAAMDNLDDGFLLMPGYSLCVFTNLYDEENISVFDVSLANIVLPYTTAVEKSTYIDNQFGKVPINVSASTSFGINNATSSVLIMFNGKILGKMFVS